MIARCVEEEIRKIFSIVINVGIVDIYLNKENTNAIKMSPNQNVLYAWMFLNTQLNIIKVLNVVI